jgi:hypothetical protein
MPPMPVHVSQNHVLMMLCKRKAYQLYPTSAQVQVNGREDIPDDNDIQWQFCPWRGHAGPQFSRNRRRHFICSGEQVKKAEILAIDRSRPVLALGMDSISRKFAPS